MNPIVTVIMPVYNAKRYVGEAIESILRQTFVDFELIIIDDGSEDTSVEVIKQYTDPRIRFYLNEKNIGSAATMNRGMDLARGKYIARMDADDISLEKRLEKQVFFLEANKDVGIVGAWVRVIGDKKEYVWRYETDPAREKSRIFFECSLAFPVVMMRKALLDKHLLRFDPEFRRAEDFDLWARASHCFPITNIAEVLLHYRLSDSQLSHRYEKEHDEWTRHIRERQIFLLGIKPTRLELDVHKLVAQYGAPVTDDFIACAETWLTKICTTNDTCGVYDKKAFRDMAAFFWYALLIRAVHKGRNVMPQFKGSSLSRSIPLIKKITFFIKYWLKIGYGNKTA